ncbi:MAG: DUF2238 domain-containing protein [Dokdonella sp.]
MTQAEAPQSARYPLILLGAFVLLFIALGISPAMREDWLLENVIAVLTIAWLLWSYRRLRLSNLAYTLLFVFGVFHEIGSHYQYSDVPYDAWFAAISGGHSLDALLGFERNQYDRFVHFIYGVLITPVAAEMITARVRMDRFWLFLLPITFMMSHAVIYELVEWLAASVFGGDLAVAYLGIQGDIWDAQKDMALATLGSLIVHPIWMAMRARR